MHPLIKALHAFCRELLTPAPNLLVWEWAEKNIYLDQRAGELSGNYSTSITPYVKEPLQAFADRSVTDLILCFAVQTAKTTIIMIGTAYRLEHEATNVVWVMPGADMGNSFSKNRWLPMVDNCPPLCAQKPRLGNGNVDRNRWGFMEQQFEKVTLNFVGSNSPSQLASRPAGHLNLDEVDKFKLETEREAGALALAEERTNTFNYPKRVKTSTPTTVHGEIWKEFIKGDQRYYNVPCPHCEKLIVFKFRVKSDEHGDCGLRWWDEKEEESKDADGNWDMDKVRINAHYKCQECGGKILDRHKPKMLREGKWVPTNLSAPKNRRSYHLNQFYSMLGRESSLGAIAGKWLATRGNMSARHGFINSTLAETWDMERASDDRPLNVEAYVTEDLPKDRTVIMTVDVQENHFWVVVRAWAHASTPMPHGESWLLLADRIETEEEVAAAQELYGVAGENVVLDMAHKPNQVGRILIERNWRGMWGSPKKSFRHVLHDGRRVHRLYSEVQYRDPHLGTKWQDQSHTPARFVYWAKDSVLDLIFSLRYNEPHCWHIHADAHKSYQRHLNSRAKMTRVNWQTGGTTYFWKELYQDDHLLDCECENLVRAIQLGLVPVPDENPAAYQGQLGV